MTTPNKLDYYCRVFGKKADEGHAGFAVAYAVLELARTIRDSSK